MPIITVQFIKDVVATPEQKRRIVIELTDKFVEILGEVVRPFVYCLISETPVGEWAIAGVPMPDLAYLTSPQHAEVINRSNELMRAALAGSSPASPDQEILNRNKQLVVSRLNDAINKRNFSVCYSMMDADFVNHEGSSPAQTGVEAFIGTLEPLIEAIPDLHCEHVFALAQFDRVAARVTYTGTHTGTYMGFAPPSGHQVSWTGTVIYRFNEAGKLVERWQDSDGMSLLIQLGVIKLPT